MGQRVAILGASNNADRYSNRAFHALKRGGHEPLPVAPGLRELEGVAVVEHLRELTAPVDTLTMYVNPKISSALIDEIVALRPGRIIFNPGSENPELNARLTREGIPFENACTLVLLATGQF